MLRLVDWLYSIDCKKKKKSWAVLQTKLSLFKTNTTKKYSKPTPANNVYRGRKKPRKQSEDKIIKAINNKIIRDLKDLCEREKKEYYYKPVRVGNFWSNNHIESESNDDKSNTLSIK